MAYSGSATERLEAVREMINKVIGGCQEYYVGSRRVRYPSLSELRKLEKELQQEADSVAGGDSMTSLGVYGGVE